VVNVSLKHIRIIFLPANTTSLILCDQGIIKTLKSYYRKQMRTRIIDNIENTNDQQQLSANQPLRCITSYNNGLELSDR